MGPGLYTPRDEKESRLASFEVCNKLNEIIYLFTAIHFQEPEAVFVDLFGLPLYYDILKINVISTAHNFSPILEAHFLCCAFWSSGSDALPLGPPALKTIGHSTRN